MNNETIETVEGNTGPTNLEDALRILREKDKTPATENVANTETDAEGAESQGYGSEHGEQHDGSVAQNDTEGELEASVSIEGSGDLGGSGDTVGAGETEASVGYGSDDYQDIQNKILESVRRQAAIAANEKFREEGIQKVTLTQLYQRDEETGRVTFHNPDDPDRPFENRAQAQAWVDSYNGQIEAEWVNYANQMQQQFANQTLPAMRLMSFAPVYDSMDQDTKDVFDLLIRNFGVTDSTGALIGYSCDLNAMYAQAREIAALKSGSASTGTTAGQVIEQAVNNPTGPALDATTSGSDTSSNKPVDPKDLNEAWKIVNKKKKENK